MAHLTPLSAHAELMAVMRSATADYRRSVAGTRIVIEESRAALAQADKALAWRIAEAKNKRHEE